MMSFSFSGSPRPGRPVPGTSAWVKLRMSLSSGTPRRELKLIPLRLAPTTKRPFPTVWARSPNTGPNEAEVLTGRPPTNLKV